MASTVAVPVWALVLLWSVGGYVAAVRLQTAILTADLTGRPTLGRKLLRLHPVPRYGLVALGVALTGPWVWWTVLLEAAKELDAWVRSRLTRWWTNRKEDHHAQQ